MKKDDIIEKLKFLEAGRTLYCNGKSEQEAEDFKLDIDNHFSFKTPPSLKVVQLPELGWCVICVGGDNFLSIKAKVKWVVDEDFAVEYLDTGGAEVLCTNHVDGQGWSTLIEATPVYQDSVEHMTDEQLRQSIEELRARRLVRPVGLRAKAPRTQTNLATGHTAEDKQLLSVLSGKTPEEMLALKRKLGLCD